MEDAFRIAACSYEGSLFGWVCERQQGESAAADTDADEEAFSTTMNWGFNCCVGSLKAMAISQSRKFVVCGGSDERVRIFDTEQNKAIGELSNHTGTVTCLEFVGDTHLLSGSEDMALCIWRVHDWTCLHILGGHKAAINDVAVHPSGKIALSVAKDNTLRIWNLIEGRCAFTRRLKGSADKVCWNGDGSAYALVVGSAVQVYDAASNALLCERKHRGRVNKALFVNTESELGSCVASISDDKKLSLYTDAGVELVVCDMSSLESRPKDFCSVRLSNGEGEYSAYLVIITSTGNVVTLSVSRLLAGNTVDEAVVAATSVAVEPRLTCLVAWPVGEVPALPPAPAEDEEEEEAVEQPRVSFAAPEEVEPVAKSGDKGKKRGFEVSGGDDDNSSKKKKKKAKKAKK
jgi:protein MAK11